MCDDDVVETGLRAVHVIARAELATENDVVDALILEGVDRITAEKLLALVPLAFGRVLMSKAGITRFPPLFNLRMKDGSYATRPIAKKRIYQPALAIGRDIVVNGPRRLLEAAALSSAEVQALNKVDHRLDVRDFEVLEPVILRLSWEEWGEEREDPE